MQNKIKIFCEPFGPNLAYLIEADFVSAERFYNAIYNFGGTNYRLKNLGSDKAFYFYAEPEKFRRALSLALESNLESSLGDGDWKLHGEGLADQIISEIKPSSFVRRSVSTEYSCEKTLTI
jgi:hypothetical protein